MINGNKSNYVSVKIDPKRVLGLNFWLDCDLYGSFLYCEKEPWLLVNSFCGHALCRTLISNNDESHVTTHFWLCGSLDLYCMWV